MDGVMTAPTRWLPWDEGVVGVSESSGGSPLVKMHLSNDLLSNQDNLKMEPECFKSQIIVATCGGLL
jgi:hypothetical protein